jgi:hypothetical protein
MLYGGLFDIYLNGNTDVEGSAWRGEKNEVQVRTKICYEISHYLASTSTF